jgi:hypothetical protein
MPGQKCVKIYRWRARGSRHGNFGDEITIPLLRKLFGIRAVPTSMREAQLIAAGSILDAWRRRPRRQRYSPFELALFKKRADLHVWGSGFMLPDSDAKWPQRLRVHAVRGPLTAKRIGYAGILGDPGILASLIVERPPKKSCSVGFVPHHNDLGLVQRDLPKGWRFISPENSVETAIEEIASCEMLVSSSLHGLITADSFGIPCLWARTSFPLSGGTDFKFHDYASARRQRFNQPVAYDQAFNMDLGEISANCSRINRSLEAWQSELLSAFPRCFDSGC